FEDDAHWRAAHWHAAARGRDAWYFSTLGTLEDALARLVSPPDVVLLPAGLARLARYDALVEALGALSEPALEGLERAAAAAQAAHVDGVAAERLAREGEAPDAARSATLPERALALARRGQAREAGVSDTEELGAEIPTDPALRRDQGPRVERSLSSPTAGL